MSNCITPIDVHAIVNAMSVEMYGKNATSQVMDTSSFVSVGESMLRTGYENTLDALGVVLFRSVIAIRPFNGVFKIIMRVPEEYGMFTRKIKFYSGKTEASKAWNTNINPATLKDGVSIDPFVITKTYPLQINFGGTKVYTYPDTTFRWQLKQAFRNEAEFAQFIQGKLVKIANDLATYNDAENRLLVANAIGATYNVGKARQKVNLVAAYNDYYGTTYTKDELLGDYYKEFMAFFVMRLKNDMGLLKDNNEIFHIYPAKQDDNGNDLVLNGHTPPEARRLILYMPRIRQAETSIFPSLFNDSYLKLENYEGVEYWMNPNEPEKISVIPNQLDVATGEAVTGERVDLDNVLAFFFDRDAITSTVRVQDVLTSMVNNKGAYYNTDYHFAKDYCIDQTENMIVYYMA